MFSKRKNQHHLTKTQQKRAFAPSFDNIYVAWQNGSKKTQDFFAQAIRLLQTTSVHEKHW